MRNGKDSCLFGEELVSYIYDELPDRERHSFEGHLLNCSSCTNEFAELSVSRLGVYEWHRDEFLPLETPRLAIPYASPEPTYSWLDAIRGFLTPARISFAGGALALLIVAFGLFYVVDDNSSGLAVVGPVVEEVNPEKTTEIVKDVDKVADDNYIAGNGLDRIVDAGATEADRKSTVTKARAVKKPVNRQLTARTKPPAKAPRLGTFEEVEDTSLRLADLVADIDSYRK